MISFQGEGMVHYGGDFPHQQTPLSLESHTHHLLECTVLRLIIAVFFSTCLFPSLPSSHLPLPHLMHADLHLVSPRKSLICHVCIMRVIFTYAGDKVHEKKSRMRGINNLKYDIHRAPRSSLHIPNFSIIQVQYLLTVAMHHGWNLYKWYLHIAFFFLIPCIFFLDMSGQQWAFILYFCLSSSQYSNDLTLLSLLGNDDDDACGFYSLAGTPVNYPLA